MFISGFYIVQYNWRAGARYIYTTGTIFLFAVVAMSLLPYVLRISKYTTIFIYPALMYAVMFYVILNKRKRLGDCVTFRSLGPRPSRDSFTKEGLVYI